jgi:hypothetical protein
MYPDSQCMLCVRGLIWCGVLANAPGFRCSSDELSIRGLSLHGYYPSVSAKHLYIKNGVFWDVTPCGSCKNRRFGGTSRLHQGDKNR